MPSKQLNEPKKNIVGHRYGRLVVVSFYGWKGPHRYPQYLTKCDCGQEKIITANAMKSGGTNSCGCLYRESRVTAAKCRLPPGEHAFNSLLNSYKFRAKKKNICFELSPNEFREIIARSCYYCGVAPYKFHKPDFEGFAKDRGKIRKKIFNGGYLFNGIDRLDSSIGYKIDNCQSCCEICNKAKRDLPIKDFKEWIQRLINYQLNLSPSHQKQKN